MKLTKLFTIATLIISLLSSCVEKKDEVKEFSLASLNLNGKVKSVRTIAYEAIDKFGVYSKGEVSNVNLNEYHNSLMLFNEEGFLKERIKYIYNYEDKMHIPNPNAQLFYPRRVFEYDNENNIIQILNYHTIEDSVTYSKVIYNYVNNFNNEITSFNEKGDLTYKSIKSIDEKNKVVLRGYNSAGRLRNVFRYDALQRVARIDTYNDDETVVSNEVHFYNDKGDISERYVFERYIFEKEVDSGYYIYYEYDNYDEKGNWTQQVIRQYGITIFIERTIEYY